MARHAAQLLLRRLVRARSIRARAAPNPNAPSSPGSASGRTPSPPPSLTPTAKPPPPIRTCSPNPPRPSRCSTPTSWKKPSTSCCTSSTTAPPGSESPSPASFPCTKRVPHDHQQAKPKGYRGVVHFLIAPTAIRSSNQSGVRYGNHHHRSPAIRLSPPPTAPLLVSLKPRSPANLSTRPSRISPAAFPSDSLLVATPDASTSTSGPMQIVGYTPTAPSPGSWTLVAADFLNAHELAQKHEAKSHPAARCRSPIPHPRSPPLPRRSAAAPRERPRRPVLLSARPRRPGQLRHLVSHLPRALRSRAPAFPSH